MPTYEYHCEKCHKNFDAVQSMKDPHFKTCPEALCQNENGWAKGEVTRLMGTGAGLIFKGSGFYITDYRSEGYKEAAKKDAAPSTGGDKGSGGGGEKSGNSEKSPAAAPAKTSGGESSGSGNGGSSSSSATPSTGSSPASSGPKT